MRPKTTCRPRNITIRIRSSANRILTLSSMRLERALLSKARHKSRCYSWKSLGQPRLEGTKRSLKRHWLPAAPSCSRLGTVSHQAQDLGHQRWCSKSLIRRERRGVSGSQAYQARLSRQRNSNNRKYYKVILKEIHSTLPTRSSIHHLCQVLPRSQTYRLTEAPREEPSS